MTDPRARLGLLVAVGLLAITLEQPASLAVLAVLCALPLLAAPTAWRRRGALAVAVMVWSTVLSQSLFYSEQPRVTLWSVGPIIFSREGAWYGLVQSLRLVSVGLAGVAVATRTAPDRLFAALVRLKVPFGLALMAVTALRFVPELSREVGIVRRARAHRGRPAHHRAPWAWLALEVSLLRPVVARSLRRAQALAESLDARGFDPVAPRAVRKPLVLGWWDRLLLALVGVLTAGAVALRVAFQLYATDSIYLPALRPVYGFVRHWL